MRPIGIITSAELIAVLNTSIMEITLSSHPQNIIIDPLPKPRLQEKIIRPEGLLNSNYKAMVRDNFKNVAKDSIFGIRQAIKIKQYYLNISIDTLLKLAVFTIVMAFAL